MRVNDDPGIFARCERRNRAFDLGGIVHAARRDFDPEAWCGCHERMPKRLLNGRFGMHEHHHASDLRCGLFQYLEPLASDWAIGTGEAGDVATRMGKVRHESVADW